eukprot:TRINITY_DN6128_c0_g1_i1.p1 TRINITY_DN6128_c0_g1~~TRINITY_DN6128_c0_g1_i1.p1  ORF type:complete len:460 (+),score=121.04 TRINITY_DN6128_c0_g1_i1:11-1390(+)
MALSFAARQTISSVAPRTNLALGGVRHFSAVGLKDAIDKGNAEFLDKVFKADLVLKDIVPAREIIPALANQKLVLVSGPPVTWKNICGAQKGAVQGIIMFEGWAKTPEEAYALAEKGEVKIEPNHHHGACGPMAGTISPSFPIYVVENKTFGNLAFSRPADLAQQFGDYKNLEDVKWWRDGVAPSLSKGLRKLGGLPLIPLLKEAQEQGDESHNRNNAFTSLFVNYLAIGMIDAGVPKETLLPILRWYAPDTWAKGSGVRACLGLVMAAAKATLDPTIGVKNSTLLSCMARNGHEFGIRVAGTGTEWFTAPSPIPQGKFFPPYKQEDAGRDMGDSAITEAAGWGSFILAASMGFLKSLPVDAAGSIRITKENAQVCHGKSPVYSIPLFDFEGAPAGVDFRRVIKLNIEPWINTGITHKDAGHRVIGRGLVRAPIEAFNKALTSFSKKHNVSEKDVLATL